MKKLIQTLVLTLSMLSAGFAFAEPVNINSATAAELSANINGVGQKKAEAIIKYREEHGPFKQIEDLMKVQGVGPGIFAKNRENLKLASKQAALGHEE
ncbi:ComEA family DNA-binding protein [Thiohalophilus thiocyanatoxydans]|uniref:Competence protein ComEA n=1 Tax=Thiohalophilus thiocyanatoxydans TaxID=381308 RepID=A0A4R8ITC7_9GAMM|nr:helix-hairpin-helix domain-containing protein [Thiohalophilus thiocyanatoxydans]TDY02660.1 competence protein ComEA [Thiohalophilus thiocyanatoxydans]